MKLYKTARAYTMKQTHKHIIFELSGEELAHKLGIKGKITKVDFRSTETNEGFKSTIEIEVNEDKEGLM